uniref:GCF C-terminal domain-containing protein n=1 Tax=Globodera rostochiensis TaxID=31243 RepID=A0A914HZQ4_GLORO
MFRKPKSKLGGQDVRNIRRRADNGQVEGEESVDGSVRSASSSADEAADDQLQQKVVVDEGRQSDNDGLATTRPVGLSFDEREGDDVMHFKLKRHGAGGGHAVAAAAARRRSVEKAARKQRASAERARAAATTLKQVKREMPPSVETEQKQQQSDGATGGLHQNVPKGEKNEMDEAADVHAAFPTTMADIPDAKAVYEARKKREMMRQGGLSTPQDFIPLDDTVRLKYTGGPSGERARLVREDENDMSDEEEMGSFYSAKKLLQSEEEQRREEQAYFLAMEQGSSEEEVEVDDDGAGKTNRRRMGRGPSSGGERGGRGRMEPRREEYEEEEEEDALQRWEREQIRKGVSSNKVMQMQEELNATSLHYRGRPYHLTDSGEADMDIEIDMVEMEQYQQPHNARGDTALPPELSNGRSAKAVSVDDILGSIRQRLSDKKERQSANNELLAKTRGQMAENTELIHKFEQGMPQLELKFRMFQETRLYTRDLLDCLNEKIVQIDALDERVSEMWRQRTERLVARRRQDVQDQYERCAATAAGRTWAAPSADYTQREAEREARRNRRRRERAQHKSSETVHHEGLSSDDEETTSQEVFYRETIVSVLQGVDDLFLDTSDEFCQLEHIMQRILHWLSVDPISFEQAYVPLCLPKLLGPFVRLRLVDWRPLKNPTQQLHSMPWYRALLLAGLDNSGLEDLEHPALVFLIPSVVEKIVFPKIAKIVREQWDPLSLSESSNLAQLLRSLVEEYPVANANSKRMQEVLEGVYGRLRDTIDRDTFVPLYSKEAIESTETGCGAFLDRQFWKSIKLMRSILCFRSIVSDACLEELLVEGLLNRFTVLALQFSVLAHQSTLTKCRAVVEQIPSSWIPPSRPNSYRPLAALLKQVVELHRRDRKFLAHAQRFIDLLSVKEEEAEVLARFSKTILHLFYKRLAPKLEVYDVRAERLVHSAVHHLRRVRHEWNF